MNKFITWIKSLSWIAIAGAIGTAVLMVLNARRAGKMEAEVAHGEEKIKKLQEGSAADIKQAKKLQDKITVRKIQAREVRKRSETSLERIGQDETMADIAARFNGKRVRSRKDAAS